MNNHRESPRHLADKFHHEIIHSEVHVPLSNQLKQLGFFANKPTLKSGVANFSISNSNRGSEVLSHQLGIGKSLIPLPQHHPNQDNSVRHLVDRAFGKKPSKYMMYLKQVHGSINNALEKHREQWRIAHVSSSDAIRGIKQVTMKSLHTAEPIQNAVEQHQARAHYFSELAAEHEKHIRALEAQKQTVVNHARGLIKIYGIDSRENQSIDSPKIVGGVWDEVT
jgi:hypothetical protein